MTTVIQADTVTKTYGTDVTALDDLTLSIDAGEIYGLLGPNGAGKTTTLELLTGQLTPDTGTIQVLDHDPTTDPRAVRQQIGILPERESPPSYLTPREYLQFVGDSHDLDPETTTARIAEWVDRLTFEPSLDTKHADLSQGQKQKIMIAKAFLPQPAVVFVDEPLSNLDPMIQETVKQYFRDYCDRGNTLVLSTHHIEVAAALCTTVGILQHGELIAEHDATTLDADALRTQFLDEFDNQPSTATPVQR